MPLAIDSVYCPVAGGGTGNPRSNKVMADWFVFPDGGCTFTGPLHAVPGLEEEHCAAEIPGISNNITTNK
jgi:hypothetical protein